MIPPLPRGHRMTVDEFLAWAETRPETEHWELVGGEVVGMSPERLSHSRTKLATARTLEDAVARAGLPCEVYVDGPTLRIDETTSYEPDGILRCGPPLPEEGTEIPDPMIVVEVVSPSSTSRDGGIKLEDYFRLPSVRHYLILRVDRRTLVHHARNETGGIDTRILRDGVLRLDPPGIEVEVRSLFPKPDGA